jgi:branched-chain amino acid transport system substrate-binding protein
MFTRNGKGAAASAGFFLLVLMVLVMPKMGDCQQPKTVKIGAVTNLSWPLGVDFKKFLDVAVPLFNKEGGLTVNGEKYNVDLILYDTKANAETGRAAVERLVNRDKVKFILGDETIDAWLPLTEANKVISTAQTPSPVIYNPKWRYCFEGANIQTSVAPVWGWFSEKFPKMKTVAMAHPDNILGHGEQAKAKKAAEIFGQKVLAALYYQPDATDFSAIATKVKNSNADIFTTCGGGLQDILLFKALYEAGWKGTILSYVGVSLPMFAKVISLDVVEGMLAGSSDALQLESMPPQSKKFRDAYIAKFGEYDNPAQVFWIEWDQVINGITQANSLDTDKVASVISHGMQFDSVLGPARMVARPDFKNQRSVSMISTLYMLQVSGGKLKLLHTMPLDEVYAYNKKFFKW